MTKRKATMQINELKIDPDTLTALCSLPDEEAVVLFFPATDERQHFEAFEESLRRERLGKVHGVAYGMDAKFTTRHWHHIDRHPSILVVIAEPPDENWRDAVQNQVIFARTVMAVYHEIHAGTEPDAFVVVYCGRNTYDPPASIGTAIQVEDWDTGDWTSVAKFLMKGEVLES
ncbi:hypothetical protein KVT40_002216 [Elsinoe batatas]|uniref:Uncharacterized protein n=1 Tax=Elsinoe batatas TaxID=2601811 RepID=A0A8K0L7Y7_9PEZI|nr:hypothetical protein KVT40_002216 [Elsinoe batatas]